MHDDELLEQKRLRELDRYRIVGTRREPEFDGLCELAAKVTGRPMASIAFVNEDQVWFKAFFGGDRVFLPRRGAFADRVIASTGLVDIENASLDPELAHVSTVYGSGTLGGLAGVPLEVKPGVRIGALCAFSPVPGLLTESQRAALEHTARAVIDRLRLHRIKIERSLDHARKRVRNAELAAQRSAIERQRLLLEQSSRMARIGGWEYDVAGDTLIWSGEIFRILGVRPNEQPRFAEVLKFYREDVRDTMRGHFRRALKFGDPFDVEVPMVSSSGAPLYVRFMCEAQFTRGRITGLVGMVQDITDQKATEARIVYLARHDTITGLPNRAVFQDRLDAALKGLGDDRTCTLALFLIDVDHFKGINDTLGHHAGDVILAEVGRRLMRIAGQFGLVARLGGDEFAVILDEASDGAEITGIRDRIMQALVAPVAYGDESIPVTISLGQAMGACGDTAEQLLKDADIALYEAKAAGRNRAVAFDGSMREEVEMRHSILRAIHMAVDRDELILYYQPKQTIRSGALAGFEALLRWRRPDGFVAAPAFFAAALDDPHLGQIIGDSVIAQATAQAARWWREGLPFGHVAINVSTSQFRRGDLAEKIFQALRDNELPATCLMLEVTENVLLSRDPAAVLGTLNVLSKAGVRIALDDFGTGYASLTHLKDFPVDLLKIDRSFVSMLSDETQSHAIVRGIARIAHDLGMDVIAEGIETQTQKDILRSFGIAFGQGYLFARPMPAGQATDLLERERAMIAGRSEPARAAP